MAPAMVLFVVLSLQLPSSEFAEMLRRLMVAVMGQPTR